MRQYLDLLERVLHQGKLKPNRTGTASYSIFGHQLDIDLQQGFPLLTTKKIHFPSVAHELLWFISGDTNIKYLKDNGVSIWDAWADENGDLGPVYGSQWRAWNADIGRDGENRSITKAGTPLSPEDSANGIDQLKGLLRSLKEDPHSRRHLISAWNVGQLDKMALAPCHVLFQFYVDFPNAVTYRHDTSFKKRLNNGSRQRLLRESSQNGHSQNGVENASNTNGDGTKSSEDSKPTLSCHLYQRSADVFLGVPFNIASYSLLCIMIAHCLDMKPGRFIHSFGDAHLYENHLDQAREQLSRKERPMPSLEINPDKKDLFDIKFDDIWLSDYDPHPAIKAPIAV